MTMTTVNYINRGTPFETTDQDTPGAPTLPIGSDGDLLMIVAWADGGTAAKTKDTAVYCSDPGDAWQELTLDEVGFGGYVSDVLGSSTGQGILRVWWRIADGTADDIPPNVEMKCDVGVAGVITDTMTVECWRFGLPQPRVPFGAVVNARWYVGVSPTAIDVEGFYAQPGSLALAIGVCTATTGVPTGAFANLPAMTQSVDNANAFNTGSSVWMDRVDVDAAEGPTGNYTNTVGGSWGVLLLEVLSDVDFPAVNAEYTIEVGWGSGDLVLGVGLLGTGTLGGLGINFTGEFDNVSEHCEEWEIQRGRDDPQSPINAGTCDLTLYHEAGRFNPENEASPLFGLMTPMREVRVSATFQGTVYTLFRGLIRDLQFDPVTRRTRIHAEDLFLRLDRVRPVIAETVAGTTGSLINDILEQAKIPATLVDVDDADGDSGFTFSMAGTSDSRTALAGIADLLEAERGVFYVSRSGKATYRPRYTQQTAQPSATLENVFRTYLPGVSIENVKNTARVTKTDGVQQVATDAGSEDLYGPSDISLESPYFPDDTAAADLAAFLVFQLSAPRNPVWELPFVANFNALVMVAALQSELLQRVTVVDVEQAGLAGDFYIESIRHSVRRGALHEVSWALSRRQEPGEIFTFSESTLGGGDILAYY